MGESADMLSSYHGKPVKSYETGQACRAANLDTSPARASLLPALLAAAMGPQDCPVFEQSRNNFRPTCRNPRLP